MSTRRHAYLPVERHPIDALIEAATGGTFAAVIGAIDSLKRAIGADLRPEDPPCTCEHVGGYSHDPNCPRHN